MTKILQAIRSLVRVRFLKNESGATALEFAIVSFPFLLLTIGIIEMSLMFTAQSVLEHANSNAARMVRTGQLQALSEGEQQTQFEEIVCDYAGFMMDCERIQYLVQEVDDFAEANTFSAPEFDEFGNMIINGFSLGGSSDVVFMRVVYRYPIVTPMMGVLLSNTEDNHRVMISTNVMRTEPYEFGT